MVISVASFVNHRYKKSKLNTWLNNVYLSKFNTQILQAKASAPKSKDVRFFYIFCVLSIGAFYSSIADTKNPS